MGKEQKEILARLQRIEKLLERVGEKVGLKAEPAPKAISKRQPPAKSRPRYPRDEEDLSAR